MAQSRPPPSRVHTTPSTTHNTVVSPPLSPRSHHQSEKRHHSRRKSGKSEHASTDKKPSTSHTRPSIARKHTPQHAPKSDSRTSRGHAQRDDRDEDRGRDSGESFPQFCMSCEKQFLPANNTFLYCSEACRIHDDTPHPIAPLRTTSYPGPHSTSSYTSHSPPLTPYTLHFPASIDTSEGPDIIPRFSPTQSRPRSYFSSDPYAGSYQAPSALSASVPHPRPRHEDEKSSRSSRRGGSQSHGSSSALESLREIAGALPKVDKKSRKSSREDAKDSSSDEKASSITRNGSAVWNYIPFTSSAVSHTATPQLSYSQSSIHSYSNGNGSSREDLHQPVSYSYANTTSVGYGGVSYGAVSYAQYGSTGGMGMDRPLPPRGGPGHRPKSIDLVTPYGNGH